MTKKNECKHPKSYVTKIGNWNICNLCGEKWEDKKKPQKEEVKEVEVQKEEEIEIEQPKVEEQSQPEEVIEKVEKPKKKSKKKKDE